MIPEEIENNDEEPSFDPETCIEGEQDGIECEPVVKDGRWFCMTCNKFI